MAAAVVARPEDAAARDAKRREEPRHRDEMRSPDAKRCRRDDAHYRVSSSSSSGAAGRKRKRERDSVRGSRGGGDRRRRYSSSSRVSCTRRSHARRTPKNRDDERAQGCKRRRSRSPPSKPKTRPQVPCAPTPQAQRQTLPAAPSCPRVAAAALANSQAPPQDLREQFEETELRRRETQRKREEARREMEKVVQSVYFNDPFVSLMDILIKR